jgi:hypothetical protein
MKKGKFLKLLIWSGSAFLVFIAVLVTHIYLVTRISKNQDERVRQLSRIDFKQNIDTQEADKIRAFVNGLSGVENSYFNLDNDILVYSYLVEKQNSFNVYNKLIAFGNYKAVRYVVNETNAQSGCPIGTDKTSISYKIAAYISKY